jgi:hypothetical protein
MRPGPRSRTLQHLAAVVAAAGALVEASCASHADPVYSQKADAPSPAPLERPPVVCDPMPPPMQCPPEITAEKLGDWLSTNVTWNSASAKLVLANRYPRGAFTVPAEATVVKGQLVSSEGRYGRLEMVLVPEAGVVSLDLNIMCGAQWILARLEVVGPVGKEPVQVHWLAQK